MLLRKAIFMVHFLEPYDTAGHRTQVEIMAVYCRAFLLDIRPDFLYLGLIYEAFGVRKLFPSGQKLFVSM